MKAYRWQAFLAVALLLLTAMPGRGAASASGPRVDLKIAIPGRFDDPQNMNIYAPGVSRSEPGHSPGRVQYFFYNNLQAASFIPWLAPSYEYAPDYSSIVVKLRDGVTWNDGQPFTADDVVFTYDLLHNNPGMVWAEETNSSVVNAEKIDPLTVRINLKTPNPHFPPDS